MNKTRNVTTIVFIGMYVAMAVALSALNKVMPIIQMPNGGSLELCFVAIFMASYHLGWKNGAVVALLSWLVGLLFGLNDYILSPLQVVFDYILPFVVIGLASMVPSLHIGSLKLSNVYTGVTVGMLLKYLSHVISGVYFYFPEGSAAGSWAAWAYSLPYNFWYCLATYIASIILVPLLVSRLNKISSFSMTGYKE